MGYLRHLQCTRLMNQADDGTGGGGAGGGGSDDTPESFTKEQVEAMISSAVEKNSTKLKEEWAADVAGLKQNRDDLKNEKLAAQQRLKDIELKQKLADADEKDLEKIRAEITETIKTEYEEQLTSTKTELDNLKISLDNKTINAALDAKLNDLKVKSTLRNALKAEILLENKPAIADGNVMLGETSLDDYFTAWQKSDRSKDFIVANPSSGGGSTGSGGSGQSTEVDLTKLGGKNLFKEAFKQESAQ